MQKLWDAMLYVFLLVLGLISVSVLLLGIKVILLKEGKFPDIHVDGNETLKKRGIVCTKAQDLQEQNKRNIFELSIEKFSDQNKK